MAQKKLTLLLVIIFITSLVISSIILLSQQFGTQDVVAQGTVPPYTVATYGNAWDGILAFGVNNYLMVMRTNGSLLGLRSSATNYGVAKNIAQDLIMFQGEPQTVYGATSAPTYSTHIWNVASNTTQDYPNVIGHHDINYDPSSNTFLTLQEYVRQVGDNSILYDTIVQLDPSGNILWSWDTFDHIPLSQASPLNETSTVNGAQVIDFTHSNALLWEPTNNIIYLNVRNVNTFYKINQTDGNIIWSCGQFGNFTLIDENGNDVPTLWYHSHHLNQIAPDVFTMFNNDFGNITNFNDANSQMIEFTLNEQNMTATLNWSWTAPKQYYSTFLGATYLLPNGDWLGDFGPPSHQFPQNQPWDFNNTGAVLIEVNPAGQIVRTITFPTSWLIYRVQLATNLSQNAFNYAKPSISPTPLKSSPSPTYSSPTPSPSTQTSPSDSPTINPSTTIASSNQPTANNSSLFIPILITAVIVAGLTIGLVAILLIRKKKNSLNNQTQ